MTFEEQTALHDEQEGSEKEERELEEAEREFEKEGVPERNVVLGSSDPRAEEAAKEFSKQLENEVTAQSEASEKTPSPKKQETATRNQQILSALGFRRYEDMGVVKFNIRVLNIKIGITFNETNPLGMIWAYKIPEGNEDKRFLKNGELKDHPLIQKYRTIQEGKEPIPETTVAGKIVERRGGAVIIEITENGEKKECSFGLGAVKKDDNGACIPAGFSKPTEKNPEQKMDIPRDIRLHDFEAQLAQAPVADTTKEKDAPITDPQKPEYREGGKTEHATMDELITPEPKPREETIANIMKTYLKKGREMVEQIFPELEQPQLSELSQDIATSMFIEDRKEARKERW